VHYLWLVKADIRLPLIYGSILAVLLVYRLWVAYGQRLMPGIFIAQKTAVRQ
jgi:DMSO/TMAO reductase YedYZ heme-binding membrane subunit